MQSNAIASLLLHAQDGDCDIQANFHASLGVLRPVEVDKSIFERLRGGVGNCVFDAIL